MLPDRCSCALERDRRARTRRRTPAAPGQGRRPGRAVAVTAPGETDCAAIRAAGQPGGAPSRCASRSRLVWRPVLRPGSWRGLRACRWCGAHTKTVVRAEPGAAARCASPCRLPHRLARSAGGRVQPRGRAISRSSMRSLERGETASGCVVALAGPTRRGALRRRPALIRRGLPLLSSSRRMRCRSTLGAMTTHPRSA
jgi:hypothetical protein